ncbi:MAG TPA: thioredoxin family protein [Limnobacter sp.]|uniref:thioredoxin family protein n=1 Tax=Limnobacter sp. TaxID=2003368 RepID=UPI002E32EEDE|nr:thioredoxin family protein [Limnobacter sp.]HEX5487068.1 thioredoxin family protein [Limnobacter sp.]
MAVTTPGFDPEFSAPDFKLLSTHGDWITLNDAKGPRGLLVMFICNHCPYVQAVLDRLVRDAHALMDEGIGVVAINSNDTEAYPEDSFENMSHLASTMGFRFPFVIDSTQTVARAYDAVCTPDFFGFNADLKLRYRGRLDASGRNPAPPDSRRDLFLAMQEVARTGTTSEQQVPSMGCSIKWKTI